MMSWEASWRQQEAEFGEHDGSWSLVGAVGCIESFPRRLRASNWYAQNPSLVREGKGWTELRPTDECCGRLFSMWIKGRIEVVPQVVVQSGQPQFANS